MMINNAVSKPVSNRGRTGTKVAVTLVLMAALVTLVFSIPYSAPTLAKSDPAHAAADLAEINVNDGFANLVKAVKPAVVNISVTGSSTIRQPGQNFNFNGQMPELEEFFRRFFEQRQDGNKQNQDDQVYERKTSAVGSGFIIDPDGLVVTNYHVIENAEEIEVVFDNGTRVPATLRGTDSKTDLALLEVEVDYALPYVVFGNSDEAEVGDWVIAIGNPFGLGGSTTSGIISARGRDINSGPLDDFIQIDAPINRGNSGGPLFNTKGEVIGVNSAIFSPNGGSVGIGFAIPSSMAGNVIAQLEEDGTVERGYLGVHIQTVTEEIAESIGLDSAHGALVSQVMEDSPAERAGIEAGDVITGYDGDRVDEMRDLPKLVALTETGTDVEVKVWRSNSFRTLSVSIGSSDEPKLATAPETPDSAGSLGLELARVDSEKARQYGLDEETVGVVIIDVDPESAAAKRGLRAGDVIKRVGNTDVTEPGEVFQAIESTIADDKESVLILVERDNQARFIVVPVKT
jgi:serine protease Do